MSPLRRRPLPPLAMPQLAAPPLAQPPLAWPPLSVLPLILLLAACQAGSTAAARPAPLRDLHGIAELRQAFNADAGKPRLILLLSPT